MPRLLIPLLLLASAPISRGADPYAKPPAAPTTQPAPTVRVAALGGINDQDFWKAVCDRFEQKTGIHVDNVVTSNKDGAPDLFKRGGIDLITLPSGDAILSLVADGYAADPQPWVQTELIIVGPPSDPAAVKGAPDAADAIKKILAAKSPFVIHASLGADQVVRDIVQANKNQLTGDQNTVLLDDHQKRVLQIAADKHAYTLIAATPFRTGKLPTAGLVDLFHGDPILRRPVIFALANPQKIDGVRPFEARRLAEFLRSDDTQQWIEHWRTGQPTDPQDFFPIAAAPSQKLPPGIVLRIIGDTDHPLDLTPDAWAKLPRATLKATNKDGIKNTYAGVLLRDVLKAANTPLGNHQLRGPWLNRTVHVHATDGFQAAFSLAELDDDLVERDVLIADQQDAHPLPANTGPLRLIIPSEKRPARWVKMIAVIEIR